MRGEQMQPASDEVEAKLAAPSPFKLPDLSELVPGAAATVLPERHLDATYFDTTDLRLARSGITLRHRSGEPGPAWTVKLPAGARGPVLERREIRFDGPEGAVPESAADIVLATTRRAPLGAVAQIVTSRLPVEIRDADGRRLAEVVDDAVSVIRPGQPAVNFREVEVEVDATHRDASRLQRAAIERLTAAGCSEIEPRPKLVQALGEAATQPPEVDDTQPARIRTLEDLVARAVRRSVAQLVRHDPGVRLGEEPEDVHQLRVATRRLRSDLRTFADLLGKARVEPLRDELRWLGTAVGQVRDADVLTARLAADAGDLPEADAADAAVLFGRLAAERGHARLAALECMRSDRYVELLEALVELAKNPVSGAAGSAGRKAAEKAAARLVRKPWRKLATAVAELAPDPADRDLHEVRILAKRCRYAAEAVAPLSGPPAAKLARAIAGVQAVLGDHQDTVVAEAWLRAAAEAEPQAAVVAGELVAMQRAERAELRGRWPGAWQEAVKAHRRWQALQ